MVDEITSAVTQVEEEAEKKRRRGALSIIRGRLLGWILGPVVCFVFFPTVLLMTFCLLPSIVAYLVDRYPEKYATRCVLFTNLAGSFGLGWRLWTQDNTAVGAMTLLSEVGSVTLVYLCAAVGWGIYYIVPRMVGTYLTVALELQLRSAKLRRLELAQEWGPDIGDGAEELIYHSEAMVDDETPISRRRSGLLGRLRFWERIVDRARDETAQVVERRRQRLENWHREQMHLINQPLERRQALEGQPLVDVIGETATSDPNTTGLAPSDGERLLRAADLPEESAPEPPKG